MKGSRVSTVVQSCVAGEREGTGALRTDPCGPDYMYKSLRFCFFFSFTMMTTLISTNSSFSNSFSFQNPKQYSTRFSKILSSFFNRSALVQLVPLSGHRKGKPTGGQWQAKPRGIPTMSPSPIFGPLSALYKNIKIQGTKKSSLLD